MARHYIKVPEFIRDYFPGGAPANWRDAVIADATEAGIKLTFEPMVPNDRGPRIAVHGDLYYFWFAKDQFRSDALFVIRMELARPPRQQVQQHLGRFERWPGGNPPPLDAVARLFGEVDDIEVEAEGEHARPAAPEPSPLLLSRLNNLPTSLVEPFRPSIMPAELGDVARSIDAFRRFSRRYRLGGRLELPPRLESVLQGAVTPRQMEGAEWRHLSAQFGFGALNLIALDDPSPDRFQQAMADLSALPLDAGSRSALWCGLLRGLPSTEVRRELHGAAPVLLEVGAQPTEASSLIEGGILRALREVAAREAEPALAEIASAAEVAADPLTHVATWAQSLRFTEPPPPETPAEPVPAPVGPATVVERPTVIRWLLRTSFPDNQEFRQVLSEVFREASEANARVTEESLAGLVAGLEALRGLTERLQTGMSRLPSAHEVTELSRHAHRAIQEADTCLAPSGTEHLLEGADLSPDDLLAIIRLLQQREDLVRAPAWVVWPDEDAPFALGDASALQLATLLSDPERRHRWQKFVDFLRQIGEPETVRWLRPPVGGASVDEALQGWFDGSRAFLESLTPEARAEALADPGMSPSALQELRREIEDLRGRLSSDAQVWFERAVDEQPFAMRLTLVRTLAHRVDEFCRTARLSATLVSAEMLRAWAAQSADVPRDVALAVQHNWVGLSGARATLTLVQDDLSRDIGFLDAPVVLESDEAQERTLRMRWTVKGEWRANWPAEFPPVEPEQLSIAKYQWRREGNDGRYQHPFVLRMPVRVSRDPRRRLEVAVTVEDGGTGDALIRDQLLRWEALSFERVPVTVSWSTAGHPNDVADHPIGPQAYASSILDRLTALSCTAVIAPRRFGKTTLVNYLVRALRERGLHPVPPVVCTEYRLGQGIDHSALWRHVSDELYAVYDTGLPGGWAGPLPPDDAFDAVRRAAHRKGHGAIVLLFDEAQLFFPPDRGGDVGSRLKARLERAWCVPKPDMTPVLLCFVGLPPFVQRAGADLTGLLVPIEARGMTEEELRPLIAAKVPALQTTRALRAELARSAGNLFILRVLLNGLAARVNREGRIWASLEDLMEVSRALAQDLRDGREESVATYIRDVLNEADDMNIWSPMVCVPVAAAIADQRPAATSFQDLMLRVVERLNEWSRASFADGRGRPTYDEDTVRRHFDRLVTLRIVSHTGDFQSVYLDAWLAGLARRWTADDAFRSALFSGGQRRISVPSGAEVVHEDRGTRILKVDDIHGPLAYRVRTLQEPRDIEVFRDNVALFDDLRRATNQGEDGAAFIFRLEDVGLSSSDPREAVQVYRWVEGENMTSQVGSLEPPLVIDIGIKLGRALRLLHGRGILHRDIQPANVIIDEGEHASADLRPVLIDFGFARVVGREMRTRIAGEFSAPEVASDQPEWSRAADVFGLCATLRAVLDSRRPGAGDVRGVIDQGLVPAPAGRPAADKLTQDLLGLARDLRVQVHRDEAWQAVRARLGRGSYMPELSATVNRHRTVLELLEAGAYRKLEERHRIIADISNQFVERKTRNGLRGIATGTNSAAVAVLYALRVLHAHPDTLLHQDHRAALASYRGGSPETQSAIIRDALSVIGTQLKAPELATVLGVYA